MVSMKKAQIEPGLLSLFRLTTALWLLLPRSELIGAVLHWNPSPTPWAPLGALNEMFMLLYLYSGWLRHRLGQRYLPIGLGVFSIGAIMVQWVDIAWHIERDIPLDLFLADRVSLLFHLFIPAIVVTVQYGFRTTIGFVLGTAVLQLLMALAFIPFARSAMEIVWYDVVWRVTIHLIIGFFVARLVIGQKKDRKTLTDKNVQLAQYATTVERLAFSHEPNRLARELHDTLAHTLSAVAVQLEAHDAQLDTDLEGAKQTLKLARKMVRNGLEEARNAVQALRASPLEDLGLALAMRRLVDAMTERSGLSISLDMPDKLDELPPEVEQSIYRITEEALNNTTRHACAQRAAVSLCREQGILT
jgi:signal transduction histidine kinase